jgi:hypothetical protein
VHAIRRATFTGAPARNLGTTLTIRHSLWLTRILDQALTLVPLLMWFVSGFCFLVFLRLAFFQARDPTGGPTLHFQVKRGP